MNLEALDAGEKAAAPEIRIPALQEERGLRDQFGEQGGTRPLPPITARAPALIRADTRPPSKSGPAARTIVSTKRNG
jgi:hypothetical protein